MRSTILQYIKGTALLPLISLTLTLLVTGCATQQHITQQTKAITAKMEAHIKAGKMDETVSGTVRIRRGEGMQMSLTKYGIEGARIVMTPDSIILLNKMNNTCIATPFSEVDAMAGGTGQLTYAKAESYFWTESGVQEECHIPLQIPNTPLSIGAVEIKMNNVKAANDWRPGTTVPSKYKKISIVTALQQLMKKQ